MAAQEVLPAAPSPFEGQIGLSAKDSTSNFPHPVQAPNGAPNVVLVLLDDVGFGASSTFGGPISTPTLDRLAKNGLRYAQFQNSERKLVAWLLKEAPCLKCARTSSPAAG